MLNRAWYLLFATLVLTSCSSTRDEGGTQPQSKVTATFTMNGKTEKLNHVYARRIARDLYMAGADEAIAVFLSSKPLPLDELGVLLKEFSFGPNDREFLKDTSITGLLFTIEKNEPSEPGEAAYDVYIMKSGRLLRDETSSGMFKDFSLARGRIKAQAERGLFSEEFFDEEERKKNLKYEYTASFETEVQGRSACTEFEGAAPADMQPVYSEPGTAKGELVVNGEQIKLEYAYARRKRVFFDEPDETIQVLITNRPYQNEEVASLLDKNPSLRPIQGLVLEFSNNPGVSAFMSIYKAVEPPTLPSHLPSSVTAGDFLIKPDRISGTTKGHDDFFKDKWTYSFSIDVPFRR